MSDQKHDNLHEAIRGSSNDDPLDMISPRNERGMP